MNYLKTVSFRRGSFRKGSFRKGSFRGGLRHVTSGVVFLSAFFLSIGSLSAQAAPTDGWKGVDLWVGGSSDDLSARWPGAMVTVLGRGSHPGGSGPGVEKLAEIVAERAGAFDALVGLRGPMKPLLILWIEDEGIAGEYGGAPGWVRRLPQADPDADALGGDVWILTGAVDGLEEKLAQALDRRQVLTRGLALPDFLEVALMDLLSAVTVEDSVTSQAVAKVGVIDDYVTTLQDLRDWESFIRASMAPWEAIPAEVRIILRPQGWAYLHYLLLKHENGAALLQDALEITRIGADFPAALQEVLVRPPDKLVQKVVRPYARKELEQVESTRPMKLPELWPIEPTPDRVLVELARVQLLRDHPEEARELFEQAEELAGSSRSRATAGLAFDARRRGEHDTAVEAFGRAVEADPLSPYWPREQARSILDRTAGEPDAASTREAVALLWTSLELDPQQKSTWTQLAIAFQRLESGREDWLEWTESKYRSAPEDRQGYVAVALFALYESAGRGQDAAMLARSHPELMQLPIFTESGDRMVQVESLEPSATISVEGAIALMKQERYEEALAAFERLRTQRQGSESWSEELERQIADLRTVVAHNRFVEAYNEAVRLFNERRYREAADTLKPVVGEVQDETRREKGEKLLAQSLEWAEKTGQ